MKLKINALLKIISFLSLLLWSDLIFAWDSTGHRLIAQIAYKHLTPDAKNKIDQLTALLDQNYPPTSRFLFASTWADQLRNDGVTAFNSWHFINLPYSPDNTPTKPPRPDNVVWAIQQSENVLQSQKTNNYEKAIFLRFLIHFVGDAHQPLHCAEMYSHTFPQGDGSGNLFLIDNAYANNLHAYWDQGLGLFRQNNNRYPLSNKQVQKLADKMQQDYPMSYFGNRANDLNPQDWAEQSFSIAKNYAYNDIKNNNLPSVQYTRQGQHIAEQQIVLAGYRLANVLNTLSKG